MQTDKLINSIKTGDAEATDQLIASYKNMVRSICSGFYITGADREDLIQEGMIGLYKAVRDYDAAKNRNFDAFARLCIKRQVQTAIKLANRKKHSPLNFYIPFKDMDEEQRELFAKDTSGNPENTMIDNETIKNLQQELQKKLSPLELQIITLFMQKKSYAEIARAINKNEKAVDNALQRIRKKISNIIKI